jgi:hypothetical protein
VGAAPPIAPGGCIPPTSCRTRRPRGRTRPGPAATPFGRHGRRRSARRAPRARASPTRWKTSAQWAPTAPRRPRPRRRRRTGWSTPGRVPRRSQSRSGRVVAAGRRCWAALRRQGRGGANAEVEKTASLPALSCPSLWPEACRGSGASCSGSGGGRVLTESRRGQLSLAGTAARRPQAARAAPRAPQPRTCWITSRQQASSSLTSAARTLSLPSSTASRVPTKGRSSR